MVLSLPESSVWVSQLFMSLTLSTSSNTQSLLLTHSSIIDSTVSEMSDCTDGVLARCDVQGEVGMKNFSNSKGEHPCDSRELLSDVAGLSD